MGRKAKPYIKDGWYVTSYGGIQHRPLCPVEDGLRTAEEKLIILQAAVLQAKKVGPSPEVCTVPREAVPGVTPTSTLASKVCDDFMATKQVEADPVTYDGYKDCLQSFYVWFGHRPIASITYEDGLKFKAWLRDEKPWKKGKQKMKGVGTARVNKYIRVAKTMFNWACKPSRRQVYGLLFNPWEEIKFAVEKPRERLITPEEFGHLIANCQDGSVSGGKQDCREMLTVLRYTTMRPGELRKLRWDYIQGDENRIVFPPQVIKTRNRREVVMIDVVKELLENRRKRCRDAGLKPTGYVFPLPVKKAGEKQHAVEAGDRMQKADSFSQRFRRLFQRCVRKGLIEAEKVGEKIVPYSTRHTRITELFVEGNSHAVVMFDAGHLVPTTTERYKHLAGSHVAEEIRKRQRTPV